MATEAMNHEGRISALEAQYKHLATKPDVERLRTDIERLGKDLGDRITAQTKWFAGILIVSLGAFTTALIALAIAVFSRLP